MTGTFYLVNTRTRTIECSGPEYDVCMYMHTHGRRDRRGVRGIRAAHALIRWAQFHSERVTDAEFKRFRTLYATMHAGQLPV